MTFFRAHILLLLALSLTCATATASPWDPAAGVRTDGTAQTPDPKKKEIITSVVQSQTSETITLYATSPEDATNARVSLYSILGKLILYYNGRSLSKNEKTSFPFSTLGLPNGPYFVVLEANGQRIVNKVILSR